MSKSKAAENLEKHFNEHLADLKELVRIPSISFDGFDSKEVRRSADAVAALLRRRGLENVEILTIPGAHPYVYGEKFVSKDLPTLLLYAHHDVQPVGRESVWQTPPFEPTEQPGPGGTRLYGRGSADDKAGIIVHTAAIYSFINAGVPLPVNVKVVIEGEEETGSAHLPQFLSTYRNRLDADVMVLTDTTNFDCGIPALTIALRGLVGWNIEVRALSKTVHSGMWGGPLPDPAMALAKILAKLVDDQGRITVPGVLEGFSEPGSKEEAMLRSIPYDEKEFRNQCGLSEGAQLLKQGVSPVVQVWRYPSLTVNAIQASSRANAGNIINDVAWAKVTIRVASGMDPIKVSEALKAFIQKEVPWGLQVKFEREGLSGAWSIDPQGPAFDAADVALKKGYGKPAFKIGCGGSIPFVKPFADALGGVPVLLIGVEDPYTNAHGENESLLISDLKSACLSQIYLFEELAERTAQLKKK